MKPIRSMMFVPGHKAGWIDKSVSSGADAIILDLEDSVPDAEKAAARVLCADRIPGLHARGQRVYVRVNRSPHLYDYDDLMAVVRPGLEGIALAMTHGPEDVALAAALVSEAESRNGVEAGSVRLAPILETARGLQFAYDCALHPRVDALLAPVAKGADLERALGFVWSEEGRETLFAKSRVVMAARAAGKAPLGGLWQQVHDLEGLRRYAEADRALGMAGMVILHPSNAEVVNTVFGLSQAQATRYRAMIAAYEAAQAEGRGAVMFEGEHIDLAHVETARAALAQAGSG